MAWIVPAVAPDPSMCVAGPTGTLVFSWDWRLVASSLAVAVLGSYAALECSGRVHHVTDRRQRRRLWWLGAALMGLAIWSMHFIGMLALRMPLDVSYRISWTITSMIAAAVGAGLAFWLTTQPRVRSFDLAMGGIAMGLAIVSMHYLGMKSLRMPMTLDYDATRFAISVLIALVASTGALWINYRYTHADWPGAWAKGGSAIVLGVAISGMHYVGMAAARYRFGGGLAGEEATVGAMPLRDLVEIAGVLFGVTLMVLAVRAATERERAIKRYEKLAAELESRIGDRTAELQRSNDDLVAFTDSVSHDLRGPLRSIHGFADALLDTYAEQIDETGRHYLRRIQAAASRLDELLLGLLKLSQISRAQVQRGDIDLSELARAVVADLAASDPARLVDTSIAPGLHASGDRALVISVLQNLLSNAWKFTRDRPDARIEFQCEQHGGRPVFVVRDNGAGFDSARAPKLFGMFERLHSASQFAGNGIGLALTKRIIERHGGRIWAEAKPGAGAAFYFTLEEDGSAAR